MNQSTNVCNTVLNIQGRKKKKKEEETLQHNKRNITDLSKCLKWGLVHLLPLLSPRLESQKRLLISSPLCLSCAISPLQLSLVWRKQTPQWADVGAVLVVPFLGLSTPFVYFKTYSHFGGILVPVLVPPSLNGCDVMVLLCGSLSLVLGQTPPFHLPSHATPPPSEMRLEGVFSV